LRGGFIFGGGLYVVTGDVASPVPSMRLCKDPITLGFEEEKGFILFDRELSRCCSVIIVENFDQ
jgi:hypothetical protein